jgi:hypothetical protein
MLSRCRLIVVENDVVTPMMLYKRWSRSIDSRFGEGELLLLE